MIPYPSDNLIRRKCAQGRKTLLRDHRRSQVPDSNVRHRMAKVDHYHGCGRDADTEASGIDDDARRTAEGRPRQYLERRPYSIGRHKCETYKRLRRLLGYDSRHAHIGDRRRMEWFAHSVVIFRSRILEIHINLDFAVSPL
jgi:hypothetical protein